jgi:hypothetical protein
MMFGQEGAAENNPNINLHEELNRFFDSLQHSVKSCLTQSPAAASHRQTL